MKVGKALNQAFDNVYVKNLKNARKRLESFKDSASNIQLKYEVVTAINGLEYVPESYTVKYRPELYPVPGNQYLVGNFSTSLYILLDAMSKNYNSFIVCDDDTIFYDLDVPTLCNKLPANWDIIVLGPINDTVDIRTTKILPDISFTRLINDNKLAGCQCIAVNKSCYWACLQEYLSFDQHGRFGDVSHANFTFDKNLHIYLVDQSLCYQERTSLAPYTII